MPDVIDITDPRVIDWTTGKLPMADVFIDGQKVPEPVCRCVEGAGGWAELYDRDALRLSPPAVIHRYRTGNVSVRWIHPVGDAV